MKMKAFTVYYDEESGEAVDIKEGPYFKRELSIMKADVYKNSIKLIEGRYKVAIERLSAYLKELGAK